MKVVAIFDIDDEKYEYWKNNPKEHWKDWTIDDFIVQAVTGGLVEFAMDDMVDVDSVVLVSEKGIRFLVKKNEI